MKVTPSSKVVGDLALVGMPIKAQIMAARPGHAANVAFAKRIKALIKKKKSKRKLLKKMHFSIQGLNTWKRWKKSKNKLVRVTI